jgi:hypothetical protein
MSCEPQRDEVCGSGELNEINHIDGNRRDELSPKPADCRVAAVVAGTAAAGSKLVVKSRCRSSRRFCVRPGPLGLSGRPVTLHTGWSGLGAERFANTLLRDRLDRRQRRRS